MKFILLLVQCNNYFLPVVIVQIGKKGTTIFMIAIYSLHA